MPPKKRPTERIREEQRSEQRDLYDQLKLELHMLGFVAIKQVVSNMKKEDQLKGELPCILCGNTLRFVIARSNNHLHVKCSREGCLKAME